MGSTHLVLLDRSGGISFKYGPRVIHQFKPIGLSRFSQPFGDRVALVLARTNLIEHVDGGENPHEPCFGCQTFVHCRTARLLTNQQWVCFGLVRKVLH